MSSSAMCVECMIALLGSRALIGKEFGFTFTIGMTEFLNWFVGSISKKLDVAPVSATICFGWADTMFAKLEW